MTIPYERTLAVLRTRELLKRLAAGEVVDLETLQHHAESLLKHYPTPTDIDLTASALPRLWSALNAKWHE